MHVILLLTGAQHRDRPHCDMQATCWPCCRCCLIPATLPDPNYRLACYPARHIAFPLLIIDCSEILATPLRCSSVCIVAGVALSRLPASNLILTAEQRTPTITVDMESQQRVIIVGHSYVARLEDFMHQSERYGNLGPRQQQAIIECFGVRGAAISPHGQKAGPTGRFQVLL